MLPSLVRTWFGGDVPLRRLSDDRAAAWGSHRDFLPSRLVAIGLPKGLYGSGWLTPHVPVEAMRWNAVVGYCPRMFRASPLTRGHTRCAGHSCRAATRLSRRGL